MELFATNRGDADPVAVGGHRVMQQVRDHAVFLLDRRGRAASWNEGVRHIFGWDEHDWLGQPLHVIFTPEDVAANAPALELQQASDSGRADDTRWMLRKNGERFFAVGAVTRIVDDRGRLAGFLKVLRDCTESQRADEERERLLAAERLARAEAERQAAALATALDAMPDAVYIGTADGITRCNAPALTMLGAASVQDLQQRRDELGRKFRVRYERDGPLVEPDDLPFARALRGETAVLETWATKADTGEDVLIRGTAAPIVVDGEVVGALAVNSDLTQRLQFEQDRHKLKQVETALHERDQEFQALVDGVREYAIFTVDVEGKISSWHEGAARMKGYSAEEAIGMPFAQLFMQADRDTGLPQQEMAAAARTGEYQGEGLRLRKNGETFDAGFVLTALRDPLGKLLGYLKLTQDISARKRQEREREKMLLSAQAARTEAERANLFKDDFLATISHELRTPLGAILGWAQVLERGRSDAEAWKQGLAAITRNARIQVQLIEDLLDMSRIESGQLRLEMRPVALAGVIAGAIETVLPAAAAKGIQLRTLLDPSAGPVSGDPDRLQQIVWNLLSNAVKFTPRGGQVKVLLSRTADALEVIVSDTGQGIAPEFLGLVFNRFQQQDASITRRHGGLGLGLAIVRQLSLLHGASVRAESAGPGHGATFTVALPPYTEEAMSPPGRPQGEYRSAQHEGAPVHPPGRPQGEYRSAQHEGASMSPPAPAPAASGRHAPARGPQSELAQRLGGITVLLIDDAADGRDIAARILRDAGARVLLAASAKEGLALLRAQRPQAILSDIGMPVHDGYDFIHWVRGLTADEGGRTPAAAFTAYARGGDRQRALKLGYQAHIVKPVEPADLVQAVTALVQGSTEGRSDPLEPACVQSLGPRGKPASS